MTVLELQIHLKGLLQEGNQLTITWDGGGDEGLLSCCINGQLLPVQHPLGIALIDYLLDYLPFSFVGPFSLQGQGVLVIKKEQVYLECQSTFEHFSEEEAPDPESWQGVRWEELLQGEFLLFGGEEGW